MRKAKLGLIASVTVGLLAVCTAGVSTYAWFQATANATVTATSNSTTITVTKPDDFTFCSYKGNESDDYTPTNTFSTDFRELTTAGDVATYTSFVGIKPGKTMLFCVKIQNPNNVNLKITKLISNNSSKQGLSQARKLCGTSKLMNIGWAMNIYVGKSSNGVAVNTSSTNLGYLNIYNNPTGSYAAANANSGAGLTDSFNYSSSDTWLDGGDSSDSYKITRDIVLFNQSSLSGDYLYLYYSVVFSNTVLYGEFNNSAHEVELNYTPTSGDRWFYGTASNPSSNCFAGLTFALSNMALTLS